MYQQSSRGISNIVAGFIIISATLVAGTAVYMAFLRKVDVRVGEARIQVEELEVIRAEGGTIVSTTLKNTGGIVLENIRVKIMCSEENHVFLTVDNLSPDHTGGAFETGSWGFRVGKTYPVALTASFENKVVLSRGIKVEVQ